MASTSRLTRSLRGSAGERMLYRRWVFHARMCSSSIPKQPRPQSDVVVLIQTSGGVSRDGRGTFEPAETPPRSEGPAAEKRQADHPGATRLRAGAGRAA